MGRNMQIAIVDENGVERASHKVTYGTKLLRARRRRGRARRQALRMGPLHPADHRREGGRGEVRRPDRGLSVRDETDDATGMTQKIVTDWRSVPKGQRPQARDHHHGSGDRRAGAQRCGNPVTYPMSVDAILSVEDGAGHPAGDVVARIPREGAKTKDITGGLPRVAELFEARRPRTTRSSPRSTAMCASARTTRTSAGSRSNPSTRPASRSSTWCPRASTSRCRKAIRPARATTSWTATPRRMTSCAIMGVEALANYLIDEVQDVYRLQGVKINDKHIEVIVRQMLQKWRSSIRAIPRC
jgi:DNA-directed RNA polymerase subunit beta'